MAEQTNTEVLIAGGGPCGLMLALELGRRGIDCLLVEPKPGTAFNPQANATQARTMEHFRRHGFADEVRAQGLPADHPTDIAYFTRYCGHELARLNLPTAAQARVAIKTLGGAWSAAELPHRVSQKFVEATMLRHVQQHASVRLRHGWRLEQFEALDDGVQARIRPVDGAQPIDVHARFLVGTDGARSFVRQQLGIAWGGATGFKREFMGGLMFAVYLRAPAFYEVLPHARAWMYVSFNTERRAFMATVDGRGEFAFHAAVHEGEDAQAWTADDARRIFSQALGCEIPVEVLSVATWTAGHALVAERFQHGHAFIAGDAAHLFTPTGGLGYNTAIEDAVNLGWKLAHVLREQASASLLESYGIERKALAERNTGYARQFADNVGLYPVQAEIEKDTPAGVAARAAAGEHLNRHVRMEFNIPGITFGGRYDGSPAIVPDGSTPPPDAANDYTPTACPGGRPPHPWLDDGRSLYDSLHFEWTLLALGPLAPDTEPLEEGARTHGLDLRVVHHADEALLALYEAPLVLIRPDQIVAWRGQQADEASRVWARLLGH